MAPPLQLCCLQHMSVSWAGSTPCTHLSANVLWLWHLKTPWSLHRNSCFISQLHTVASQGLLKGTLTLAHIVWSKWLKHQWKNLHCLTLAFFKPPKLVPHGQRCQVWLPAWNGRLQKPLRFSFTRYKLSWIGYCPWDIFLILMQSRKSLLEDIDLFNSYSLSALALGEM